MKISLKEGTVDVICLTSPDFPISLAKVYTRLFSLFVAKHLFTIKLLVSDCQNLWCKGSHSFEKNPEQVYAMYADICSEQAMFLQVKNKSNPL